VIQENRAIECWYTVGGQEICLRPGGYRALHSGEVSRCNRLAYIGRTSRPIPHGIAGISVSSGGTHCRHLAVATGPCSP
jgi:hypothetical protein